MKNWSAYRPSRKPGAAAPARRMAQPGLGLARFAAILLGFAAFAAAVPAGAACTPAEKAAGDAAITSFSANSAKVSAAMAAHLPWGAPSPTAPVTNEMTLVQENYVIDYDTDLRVPVWTAERVVASKLDDKISRLDCFRGDARLDKKASSVPADYSEPIYDQGHMTSFADQRYSKIAGINSFVMTNMAPQNCQLNRGIWQILEQITRRWAARQDKLYVLSGSVFDRDGNGLRDSDSAAQHMHSNNGQERVGVPSAFYKVIAFEGPRGNVETISFLLPHDEANPSGAAALAYLTKHITTVAAIERLSGLDLFPEATDVHESATLWQFDGYKPQSLCHARPAASHS
jgi:endonuclease G